MPVDPKEASFALARGVSAVCVSCDNYWSAREKGVPNDRCSASGGCGSPIAGDDFHEYKGPITDFTRLCFVCGRKAVLGVRAPGCHRICGICEAHKPLLNELRPKNPRREIQVPLILNGRDVVLAVRQPQRKSLLAEIMETERYFAEQAATGKRG